MLDLVDVHHHQRRRHVPSLHSVVLDRLEKCFQIEKESHLILC